MMLWSFTLTYLKLLPYTVTRLASVGRCMVSKVQQTVGTPTNTASPSHNLMDFLWSRPIIGAKLRIRGVNVINKLFLVNRIRTELGDQKTKKVILCEKNGK